jgi:2-keto-4-pentenoate hydratase/2-oxohepta-3-ene-1,7-dioic acid hydratase in catechol pathway
LPFTLVNVAGRAALVKDGCFFDLEEASGGRFSSDPMQAVAAFSKLGEFELSDDLATGSLEGALFGPPVPAPGQIFGVGLNYRTHAAEFDVKGPERPLIFAKFPSSIAGPHDDIVLSGDKVDWEVELVAVIGTEARDVPRERAWEYVAGLMIGQDISDREKQFEGEMPQFSLGKSYDGYAPTGPFLVSACSFTKRQDLSIECEVSGEGMQAARTSEMIFDVPFLVAYLSAILTLRAGDLIFTGTPEGVGMATGRFLRGGDLITSRIEGLGQMTNRCVAKRSL